DKANHFARWDYYSELRLIFYFYFPENLTFVFDSLITNIIAKQSFFDIFIFTKNICLLKIFDFLLYINASNQISKCEFEKTP
ncbi:MAG TPA: hypothetical protein PLF86_01390, partial [Candidatus Moranbacteria bacterium]|nr:hypothetical protein [Candidatus Moranbacteria bacterium]